jgi:hypothetical protein
MLFPGNVGRVIVGQEHGAIAYFPTTLAASVFSRHHASGVDEPSAPGEGPGMGGMTHQQSQGFAARLPPLQLIALRPACRTERPLNPMLMQITQDAADAAQRGELVQSQPDHVLHLLVGVEL